LLKRRDSSAWATNEAYALRHANFEIGDQRLSRQEAFSFPDCPVPTRAVPPFRWAVELLAAVLATPLPSDTTVVNFRYGARLTFALKYDTHIAFWREITARADHVAAITTNYDMLIERALRPRPMKRVFGPGCYYGGLPRPQVLRGTQPPGRSYAESEVEMDGAIPLHKLHGSLNWARTAQGLDLFQDLRAAFRNGGDAAIIPPTPEKEIPEWLLPVWRTAEEELSRAETWIVCGYSLPNYDLAVFDMLRRAAMGGCLRRILILDPLGQDLCNRYSAVAPSASVKALGGLPDGIEELSRIL
jgi:hypothetical protein